MADRIRQLPHVPQSKWRPTDVDAALASADTGQLPLPADLCESMFTDDRMQSAGQQRFLGLQGLELLFSGERNADLETGFHAMFPASELVKLHRWGTILGIGIGRLNAPDPAARTNATDPLMPRLETWHPRSVSYTSNEDRYYATDVEGVRHVVDPDDGWILFLPYGAVRPWAEGLWRSLAFAWILKRFALHDRARHGEINGTPIRVGSTPQGSVERARQKWRDTLQKLGRDSVVILPPGYDLKLLETQGKGAELYEKQIEWADRAITQVHNGQAITTEGSNMGFGEGGIFREVQRSLINFDARVLTQCLHPYIDHWFDLNYGSGDYRFTWNTTPPVDQKTRAEALLALSTGIASANNLLSGTGKRVDSARMLAEAGFPIVETKESSSTLFSYHLDFGLMTVNEARERIGLPPTPDGDRLPTKAGTIADVESPDGAEPADPTGDQAPQEEPSGDQSDPA
jgi:hypothetical protein